MSNDKNSKVVALHRGAAPRPSPQPPTPKEIANQQQVIRKLSAQLRKARKASRLTPKTSAMIDVAQPKQKGRPGSRPSSEGVLNNVESTSQEKSSQGDRSGTSSPWTP